MRFDYGSIDKDYNWSRSFNDQAPTFAPFAREGAVVHIVNEIGVSPAPAWYDIRTGDAWVDLRKIPKKLGSWDAAKSDLGSRSLAVKVVRGAVTHELAHSRWTDWLEDPALDGKPDRLNTLLVFEEGRIERAAVNVTGNLAIQDLRACFSQIILPGFFSNPGTSPYQAAGNYALVMGRVHAGHVTYSEITDVDFAFRGILGDDVVDTLDDILAQALLCRTYNPAERRRYYELADEWNEFLRDEFGDDLATSPMTNEATKSDEDSNGQTGETLSGAGAPRQEDEAEDGDGTGGDDDDDADEPDDFEVGIGSQDSTTGDGFDNDDDPWLSDLNEEKILEDTLKKLAEVVSAPSASGGVTSPPEKFAKVFTEKHARRHPQWKTRPPTSAERQASTMLTRLFEEMATPAITKRKAAVKMPPGRLNSREAVRRSADRAAGRMTTARPWQVEKRKHDTVPPILVGIATDTSGSMKWAESMVASTAWIFATAGHRIGARVAAVTFGTTAEAVVHPNEIPDEVRIRKANGSHEAFDDAMAALDSQLRYTDGRPGKKVLVVVSDGQFVRGGEPARRKAWLEKLNDANVDVIWMHNHAGTVSMTLTSREHEIITFVECTPGDFNGMVREVVTALKK